MAWSQANLYLLKLLSESDALESLIGLSVSGKKSSLRSKLAQLVHMNAVIRVNL